MESTDLVIIGGGINGTAIAADAAGRGLSVVLLEKSDVAAATSSASTKLIHGGLRYLELYEFALVRNALREREILMRKAPHLIAPLEFILPHEKHLRPIWLMRIGLFLYDHLIYKKFLPNSKHINLKKSAYGAALHSSFTDGFSYYDCSTDDARLTLENALAAQEKSATILTRHEFLSAQRENAAWRVTFRNLATGKDSHCHSKVLINASGPWINHIQQKINPDKPIAHELVKGSHIVVPKLFSGNFAYILQNKDKRIVFAIPYQDHFTLIGTTDFPFNGDLEQDIKITSEEENYLCDIINHYFKKTIMPAHIVWSYAGVRCLQQETTEKLSEISRDYKIKMDIENQIPLLTIIGGKITTHRSLAEEAVNKLKPFFPAMRPAWTATEPLPGGAVPGHSMEKFLLQVQKDFPWLSENLRHRYAKNYGTKIYTLLRNAKNMLDLGENFTQGLYEKELNYLIQQEWAQTLDDIIWRRTKLGLVLSEEAKSKIAAWLTARNNNTLPL